MLEYEFEELELDYGAGYNLFTGITTETAGHREIIAERAARGWRYAGYLPVVQRGGGQLQVIDLIFERSRDDGTRREE